MAGKEWVPGGFYDRFARALDAVGFEEAGVAWGIANVEWAHPADLDRFLDLVTAVPAEETGIPGTATSAGAANAIPGQ